MAPRKSSATAKNKILLDKIKGALYGVAVADALGGPLEFMTASAIAEKHGGPVRDMIGGGWLNLEPGEVTDDTMMSVCVAMGVREQPEDPVPAVGYYFTEWVSGMPKDIGGTCSQAIRRAIQTGAKTRDEWLEAGRYVAAGNDKNDGNGALMRTIFTALWYGGSLDKALSMTDDIGSMTHDSDKSRDICRQYVAAIIKTIYQEDTNAITEYCAAILKMADSENRKDENGQYLTTGYVLDSAACAAEAILQTASFEDAIVNAINRGGDADTIGAICGGMAGALYGYNAIPARWLEPLVPEQIQLFDDLVDSTITNANKKKTAKK